MAQVELHRATEDDIAADPAATRQRWRSPSDTGPIRPGEEISYLRFWMHREVDQGVSAALNLTAVNSTIYWTTHPKLAWNFIAIADPDFLEPALHRQPHLALCRRPISRLAAAATASSPMTGGSSPWTTG